MNPRRGRDVLGVHRCISEDSHGVSTTFLERVSLRGLNGLFPLTALDGGSKPDMRSLLKIWNFVVCATHEGPGTYWREDRSSHQPARECEPSQRLFRPIAELLINQRFAGRCRSGSYRSWQSTFMSSDLYKNFFARCLGVVFDLFAKFT